MGAAIRKVARLLATWYTYVATAAFTLLLGLVVYGHATQVEKLPADFANKKTGAGFSLLSSNALRDVSITRGASRSASDLRLVNVQGISVTPINSTFFVLVGSSKAALTK